jgi:hypothetical protein
MAVKPKTRKVKTRSSVQHEKLIDEMRDLRGAIDDLHDEVHKLTPPTAFAKIMRGFVSGVIRGVGFVVGTTVVAAVLVLLAQQAIESGKFQDWISSQVSDAITESIDDYAPSFLQRD